MIADFEKLGGVPILLSHLELDVLLKDPELACEAAQVVGSLTGNTPKLQTAALLHNAVSLIVTALGILIGKNLKHIPRAELITADPTDTQTNHEGDDDGDDGNAGQQRRPSEDVPAGVLHDLEQTAAEIPEALRLKLMSKLLLALGCIVRSVSEAHKIFLTPGCWGFAFLLDLLEWTSLGMQRLETEVEAPPMALRQNRNILQKLLRLLEFFSDTQLVREGNCVAAFVVHRSGLSAVLRIGAYSSDRLIRECLWDALLQLAKFRSQFTILRTEEKTGKQTQQIISSSEYLTVGQRLPKLMNWRYAMAHRELQQQKQGQKVEEDHGVSAEAIQTEIQALETLATALEVNLSKEFQEEEDFDPVQILANLS